MRDTLLPDYYSQSSDPGDAQLATQPNTHNYQWQDNNKVGLIITAQWHIITRTLERVLGKTEMYEEALKALAKALYPRRENTTVFEKGRETDFQLPGLFYQSPKMYEVARQIYKTRDSRLPALLTGEPGTGKEAIARAIHLLSGCCAGPFVAFNCTIATKELMSSQLFGHRKGSFTGADANYQGSIRSAEGGTIFLDEIGDLPLDLQPKLLRFLQEGEIHPVGESKPVKVDVRVIAATNRDLEAMVAQGQFREDLYYRINILRFHLPPLRERREEIPTLALHLLERYSREVGKGNLMFTPETLAQIYTADWPGNVRQLTNEIQRAVAIVTEGEALQPYHLWPVNTNEPKRNGKLDWLDEILVELPPSSHQNEATLNNANGSRTEQVKTDHDEAPSPVAPNYPIAKGQTLAQQVEGLERVIIIEALERLDFHLSRTAQELGLTRRGLYLKMNRCQIDPKQLKRAKARDAKPA